MTAITALNVRLGMDASNFSEGANLTRSEVNKVAATMRQSVPPAEKYQREVEILDRAFNHAGKQSAEYANAMEFLRKKHNIGAHAASQHSIKSQRLSDKLIGMKTNAMSFAKANPVLMAGAAGFTALAGAGTAAAVAIKSATDVLRAAQAEIDETAKAATALGLTFNDLTGIRLAAGEMAGLDASVVDKSIQRFQVSLARAAQGDKRLEETFRAIGVDAAEAMAEGPTGALLMLSEGWGKLTNQAEKLNVATELFGRSGAGMVSVLDAGGSALEEAVAFQEKWNGLTQAQVLGVEANNDAWGRVNTMVDGITTKLAAEMAPVMQQVADTILGAGEGFDSIDRFAHMAADQVVILYSSLKDVVDILVGIVEAKRQLQRFDFSGAADTLRAATESDVQKNLLDLYARRGRLADAAAEKEAERVAGMREGHVTAQQSLELYDSELTKLKERQQLLEAGPQAVESQKLALQGLNDEQLQALEAQQSFVANLEAYDAELDAIQERTRALTMGTEELQRYKREQAGLSKQQIAHLEALDKVNKKMEERAKLAKESAEAEAKLAKETKKVMDELNKAFELEVDSAFQAARQFFEQERQRDAQMREQISAGPGAGIEVGSAGAAKFMADQVNAQIGAAVVPEKPTPGEKEIADKTRELLLAQRAANAEQARQSEVMREQLAELKENRFTRIR